jgi:hypothetical protein
VVLFRFMRACVARSFAVWAITCGLVSISPCVFADDLHSLETALRNSYEHQLLSLKSPSSARTIEFDSSGRLVSKSRPGPWSTCGLLQVEKISLNVQRLEIDGRRVLLALRAPEKDKSASPQTQSQVTPILIERRVQVLMNLASLPTSISSVNDVLSQAFAGGELLDRAAKYWKPNTTDLESFRKNTPNAVVGELEGGRPVYLVKGGVVEAPTPIHTPDPEYTETARQKHMTGTAVLLVVINEEGVPEVLEVTKGLGEGLDVQALITVSGSGASNLR